MRQEKISRFAPQASFGAFFSEGLIGSPVSKTPSGECNAITKPMMLLFSRGRLEEEVLIIEAKIGQERDGLHLGAVDVAVGVQ